MVDLADAAPAPNPKFSRPGLVGLSPPGEVGCYVGIDGRVTYAEVVGGQRLIFLSWADFNNIRTSRSGDSWQALNMDVVGEGIRLAIIPENKGLVPV
jgi:hypothetical protein